MNQNKIFSKRHIVKTVSYRIISSLIGFSTMWLVTGSFKIGMVFGLFELFYKPIQYYIHEKIWHRWIKFDVKDKPKKTKPIIVEEPKIEKPKDNIKRLNYTRR